jgi:hypothetical protein
VYTIVLNFSGQLNSTLTTGAGALNPSNYMLSASPFAFTQAGAQPFTPPYGGSGQPAFPTVVPTLIAGPAGPSSAVMLTFNGALDGGSLRDGDYQLTVQNLADVNGLTVASTTVNLRRLFGDFNRNGFLDFQEFSGIYSAQGSRVGDVKFNPGLDFDGDVDVNDQIAFFNGNRFARSNAVPPNQYPPLT